VSIDEFDDQCCGRSSSAAKKADASFRISFALRSSRFSERSFLISADSTLVVPGRVPASTSAFLTQLWTVCADPIPSFDATDSMAAHSEACSDRTSATIRTARSRSSFG